MTTKSSVFMFFFGLLLTFGAVGGVENSITDTELLSAVAVAAMGLALMYVGTLGIRNGAYYD